MLLSIKQPVVYTVTESCEAEEAWAMDSIELREEFGGWPELEEAVDSSLCYWGDGCLCNYGPDCAFKGYMSHAVRTASGVWVQAHFTLPIVAR